QIDVDLDTTDRKNVKVNNFSGKVYELSDQLPDNEKVEQVLEEFKEVLRVGKKPDGTPVIQDIYEPHMAGTQFGYGGSIYCQECHGAIYAGWLKTRHNQAYQTLVGKNEQNNPGCLECHTVGYSQSGGYAAKQGTYLLANVQCESCHGAAADHMKLASDWQDGVAKEKPVDWKIQDVHVSQNTCITCHNPDNDPNWKNGVWPYADLVKQVACSQWLTPADTAAANPGATTTTGNGTVVSADGTTTTTAGGGATTSPAGGTTTPPPTGH
ncbi:MAG: cytochrome c family protein, partial [bacterium]